ncbi:hypothetical protein [Legionella waltersii]|uniref:LidA long coiled-coil domain-containing protein n=1 Tax=Legionella waltersii TaxID=66969 RepID=A0A0W1AD35_9GAMM|nr:hypothetical protein [Legionella waltersii]KTD79207.1 hypothetical protein Lwal_1279 [Legionella waltersii]SNV12515.1 Uncharacterised protein [Legionella waltersii]
MSNDKADLQTVAPDFARFGFTNKEALEKFLRSDEGKLVQSHQMAVYMEKKHQEEILADYFTRQEEIRRAVIAAILMEEIREEEESRQKQAEAAVQNPVTTPTAPKTESPASSSENDVRSKLDSVNKDIIHAAKKYKDYDKAVDQAQKEADVIDKMPDSKAQKELDLVINYLEAKQGVLQEKMRTLPDRLPNGKIDPDYDSKLLALVDENNTNEVQLGVFRTLRDVKQGKADMYDENGEKTLKFSEARYTVPKSKDSELVKDKEGKVYLIPKDPNKAGLSAEDKLKDLTSAQKVEAEKNATKEKEIVKDPKTGKFYLIQKDPDNEGLSAQQKLQKLTDNQKDEAERNFKKAEPNMVNVKEFLQNNKKNEMIMLHQKQSMLITKLQSTMTLGQNPSQVNNSQQNPPPLVMSPPTNTQITTINPSSLPVGTPQSAPTSTKGPSHENQSEKSPGGGDSHHRTVSKH